MLFKQFTYKQFERFSYQYNTIVIEQKQREEQEQREEYGILEIEVPVENKYI